MAKVAAIFQFLIFVCGGAVAYPSFGDAVRDPDFSVQLPRGWKQISQDKTGGVYKNFASPEFVTAVTYNRDVQDEFGPEQLVNQSAAVAKERASNMTKFGLGNYTVFDLHQDKLVKPPFTNLVRIEARYLNLAGQSVFVIEEQYFTSSKIYQILYQREGPAFADRQHSESVLASFRPRYTKSREPASEVIQAIPGAEPAKPEVSDVPPLVLPPGSPVNQCLNVPFDARRKVDDDAMTLTNLGRDFKGCLKGIGIPTTWSEFSSLASSAYSGVYAGTMAAAHGVTQYLTSSTARAETNASAFAYTQALAHPELFVEKMVVALNSYAKHVIKDWPCLDEPHRAAIFCQVASSVGAAKGAYTLARAGMGLLKAGAETAELEQAFAAAEPKKIPVHETELADRVETKSPLSTQPASEKLADEFEKPDWKKKYIDKDGNVTPDGKAAAKKLAEKWTEKEIDEKRLPAVQQKIENLRVSTDKRTRALQDLGDEFEFNPLDPVNREQILDESKKLCEEQLELMRAIGKPDNEMILIKEHKTNTGVSIPDHYILRSKPIYKEGSKITSGDSGHGFTANRSIDGFIRRSQSERYIEVDPLMLHLRGAVATTKGDQGLIFSKVETKRAQIESGKAILHEADHGIRDIKMAKKSEAVEDAMTFEATREERLLLSKPLDAFTKTTQAALRSKGLSEAEVEKQTQTAVAKRAQAVSRLEKHLAEEDEQANKSNLFSAKFVTLKGQNLGYVGYGKFFRLDELRTYSRDFARNQTVKDRAAFIKKALGPEAVPSTMKVGDVMNNYKVMSLRAQTQLAEVRKVSSSPLKRDSATGHYYTAAGDEVQIEKTADSISAKIPVIEDDETVGMLQIKIPKVDAWSLKTPELSRLIDKRISELQAEARTEYENFLKRHES